ncbi:MAG: FUSC family protein [Janthinobacterium lividum]
MRAALAVAAIMLLNEWLQIPLLAEAALGAMLTCLSDAGGPIRRRVPALLTFAALGALVTTGFGLLRPLGLPVVVPLATLVIFGLCLARLWGPTPMQVGNLLVVVTVLALDHEEPPEVALMLGGLFTAGSLWAALLTLVIWRLHPFRPTRQAVAEVFRRMSLLVGDLMPLLRGADVATWEEHARAHRRHVRDGIELARTLVMDTLRIRGGGSVRANQSVIQVEAADQLFGVLIALSDVLEQADASTRAAARQALPSLHAVLRALAEATARDHAQDDPAVRATTRVLLAAFERLEAQPALAGIASACVSRLRIALLLTTPEGLLPGRDGTEPTMQRWRERVLAPVRANMHWSSAILRHATRTAVVAGPALFVTLSFGNVYAHWLTITMVMTLQPFFATTWQRALERSAGTVLGGILAAVLASFVHSPLATAAVLTPLAITSFAMRGVSFGLFIVCLTPMVVLLSELGRPGESEILIAAFRAGYTVLGGALAVAGGALLWPSWEPQRVREALAAAILAHAAYADLELAALLEPGNTAPARLEAVRRAAGLASNNLETALNRALQEPRNVVRNEAETALVVDAALRRLAGRLLALQHDPAQAGSDPALLQTWRTWLAGAFAALAARQPLPPGQPPDRAHPAMGRMARQIELIAGSLLPSATRAQP